MQVRPASKSGERTISANDTVTGNDQRNPIGRAGAPYRSCGCGTSDHQGHLGIGACGAKGNLEQGVPDGNLKRRPSEDKRHVEGVWSACKIIYYFSTRLRCPSQVLVEAKTISRKLLLEGKRIMSVKKLEPKQGSFAGGGKLKSAHRGIDAIEIRLEHILPFLPGHSWGGPGTSLIPLV